MASSNPLIDDSSSSSDDDSSYELIGSTQSSVKDEVAIPQMEEEVPSTTSSEEEKKTEKEEKTGEKGKAKKTKKKREEKWENVAFILMGLIAGIATLRSCRDTRTEKTSCVPVDYPTPVNYESFNFSSPSLVHLGGFPEGRRIRIVGLPSVDAVRIDIDLRTRMDIPFHFNPRFEHKVVVRNHAVKGEWNFEMEERSGGFPFKRNEIFTLEFVSRKGHIQVIVNGVEFTRYAKRIPSYTDASLMMITGQVNIHSIQITSANHEYCIQ